LRLGEVERAHQNMAMMGSLRLTHPIRLWGKE